MFRSIALISTLFALAADNLVAGSGILEVESKPGGAMVIVNGKRKGMTPTTEGQKLSMELPEGDHTLELKLDGYTPLKKPIFLGENVIQPMSFSLSQAAFTNSLGMKFVPIPIKGGPSDGESVLFSIYETRVKDFRAFVKDTQYNAKTEDGKRMKNHWESPGFTQTDSHPVVYVSWKDARAFCAWLTEKERKSGKIAKDQRYRLPTDHEWSCAVGIGDQEKASASPKSKGEAIDGVFPWGTRWPPRKAVGNYWDKERDADSPLPADGYKETAPVGQFDESSTGLYDLGGNVWEWCYDLYNSDSITRILRGGSCSNDSLLPSYRGDLTPGDRNVINGFRCILSR